MTCSNNGLCGCNFPLHLLDGPGHPRPKGTAKGVARSTLKFQVPTAGARVADSEERVLSGLKVRIDRRACIGTQNCVHVAPEVFVLGTDQIVTFCDHAEEIEQDRLIEACAICPVDALYAFNAAGDQIVPW